MRTPVTALFSAALLIGSAGCASWFSGGSSDLNADHRFAPSQAAATAVAPQMSSTPERTDEAGHVAPMETPRQVNNPTAPKLAPVPPSPAPAPPQSSLPPATLPTSHTQQATSNSSGTYMTLGGIVAEVNEHPIYANQVLREIVGPLSARARELDARQFRTVADELIKRQIQVLANNEREVAAAQRNLDDKDKEIARLVAARWRERQITESGGSVEQAKRKWAEQGYDFEDRVEQEYRNLLTHYYYQRKVWPRVQVTADEMRRFYAQHLNDQFTEHDEIRFRLIKIDPKRTGSRDKALDKAKDLYARAARGEDFAELAATVNDDPYLVKQRGDVGWVQKGAYVIDSVEKSVWTLQPGQVSDIIDTGRAFYIAKVDDRKLGRVMPFDEQKVQDTIRETLRNQQFTQLRNKVLDALSRNSVVRTSDAMVNTAIDMAMQNYPRWRNSAPAPSTSSQ